MPKTPASFVRDSAKAKVDAAVLSADNAASINPFKVPSAVSVEQSHKRRKDDRAASSHGTAERRSAEDAAAVRTENREEKQLYVEDFATELGRDQGKKLLLVKIPLGVDVSSLVGKKISSKKRSIDAAVKKRGRRRPVELLADVQESTEEMKKWSIFLPSNQAEAGLHLVRQRLEGSITLSYSGIPKKSGSSSGKKRDDRQ
ncbi:hypothetical protein BV898_04790 [Hypsibius exemplaris]|uniref:Uncharacterized protein n=1 Tax=Hypsibius exemplaris TaxID=2072580 RepID=A0A1W0X1I1_HYPEX|nr:hypothetical protein BV898_04790 [Hypsibius exemplaris]